MKEQVQSPVRSRRQPILSPVKSAPSLYLHLSFTFRGEGGAFLACTHLVAQHAHRRHSRTGTYSIIDHEDFEYVRMRPSWRPMSRGKRCLSRSCPPQSLLRSFRTPVSEATSPPSVIAATFATLSEWRQGRAEARKAEGPWLSATCHEASSRRHPSGARNASNHCLLIRI